MTRPKFRRTLRVESLESRQLLTGGGPTPDQQYMLQLLNLTRTNPAEMAQRVTSNLSADVQATLSYYNVNLQDVKNAISSAKAQPPLAWNGQLANAATGHSQDMANTGVQSHTGSDGSNSSERMQNAGYNNQSSSGENAYAYSTSVDEAMEAFLIDWGVSDNGHRNNILQPNSSADGAYRDVGIGIVNSNKPDFGPLVITQDFGAQNGEKAQLVGAVYNDPNHINFYTPGQGVGGVTIQATNESTGKTVSVQTWDAGGYEIPLDPGTYKVTAIDNNQVVKSQDVTVGTTNVEVDYDLSNPWQGGPIPSINPPPASSSSNTPVVAKAAMLAPTNNTSSNSNSSNSNSSSSNSNSSNANPPTANSSSSNSSSSNSNSSSSQNNSNSSSSSNSNSGSSSSSGWSIYYVKKA